MIDRSPEVVGLAVDLHEHLVEVLAPMTEPAHRARSLTADVGCEERPEPVPPEPHSLVADVDATLNSRSSTFLSDSGKRTYISTTSLITSGELLKYRNGLAERGL